MNDPLPARMTTAEIVRIVIAMLALMFLIILMDALVEPKRDLAFDNALAKLCTSYVRWTKLAHDHVEGMDRRCNRSPT